jgi:hypothetical protein
MKKENKNIFLHIIDADYKAKKQKESENIGVSEKTLQLIDNKDVSVVERLRKMHGNFGEINEPELSEPTNELNQAEPKDPCESLNSLNASELHASYQKITAEEQELIARKKELLSIEQNLREKLVSEIGKKKKAIEALHLEISTLQNTCTEISQSLSPT